MKFPTVFFIMNIWNSSVSENNRRKKKAQRKILQELTIKDIFTFGAVMVDEELCMEFLELC